MRFRTRFITLALLFPLASVRAQQGNWTVDAKPLVDIAGSAPGGAVNFGLLAGATRLADGTLLIADRGDFSVRLFDAGGKLLRRGGGNGAGPGEFQSMVWAGGCGADSLLVWDSRLQRGSFIGKGGTVARQFTVTAEPAVRNGYLFNCAGSTIAVLTEPSGRGAAGSAPGLVTMQAQVVTLARDGRMLVNHGLFNSGEFVIAGNGGFPRPLGTAAGVAMIGGNLVIGSADSASVLVISANGTRRTLPVPGGRRAPTRGEFDASVQAIGSMAPAPLRQRAIDQLSATPVPALLPPYFALFTDPAGLLWLQLSPSGARQVDLAAMQLDGKVAGRISLPQSLTIHEIGADFILGSYTDTADEQHVAVYRLHRTP